MEENAPCKSTMVSKLPKFGCRSNGGSVPLLPHVPIRPAPSRHSNAGLPPRVNGVVRPSAPASLNGKQAKCLGQQPNRPVEIHATPPPNTTRELKKPTVSTLKLHRFPPSSIKPKAPSGHSVLSHGSLRQSLSLDNMVRSQSFTHFKQLSSTGHQPITRSLSFNKAVEIPANRLRTKASAPKPGLTLTGKVPAHNRDVSTDSSTVHNGSRKSPLSHGSLNKPSLLSYRRTRPSLLKQPRSPLAASTRINAQQNVSLDDPLAPSDLPSVPGRQSDILEDMSLSSTSSLERNDTSEEYLDDFDNLGDGGGASLLLPAPDAKLVHSQPSTEDKVPDVLQEGVPVCSSLQDLISDSLDWEGINLAVCKEDFGIHSIQNDPSLPPDGDFPGSSLDLSPSDSSGGTYMWDEEGMEHLGIATHPCGSYDSDINSMDILNNLENLESCDLEEDDLMLDVDLPEDGSLHSDGGGTSSSDYTESGRRLNGWRRRQHCWDGNQMYDDNRGPAFSHYDSYLPDVDSLLQPIGPVEMMDELTLEDMAENCSSVKSQLLKLKTLLQLEDEGIIEDSLPSEAKENISAACQVEALMREVQELRQELQMKEMTISVLTQQMSNQKEPVKCQCQQKATQVREEHQIHWDKSTQTSWKGHTGLPPARFLYPWQATPRASAPHRRQRVEQLVHYFHDKAWGGLTQVMVNIDYALPAFRSISQSTEAFTLANKTSCEASDTTSSQPAAQQTACPEKISKTTLFSKPR